MRRIIAFLAVLVLSLGLVCNVAYADGSGGGGFEDKVIYGPSVYNVAGQTYCVQVYAGNNLNAALTALGYDSNDSRFTSDVKAYLSDSTYGGSFYQFAQQFTNNNEPNWGVTIYSMSYTSALSINNSMYGAEYVYGASYTQQLLDAAKQRVEDVLAGNIGDNGGTSSGEPLETALSTVTLQAHGTAHYYTYNPTTKHEVEPYDATWIFSDSVMTVWNNAISGGKGYYLCLAVEWSAHAFYNYWSTKPIEYDFNSETKTLTVYRPQNATTWIFGSSGSAIPNEAQYPTFWNRLWTGSPSPNAMNRNTEFTNVDAYWVASNGDVVSGPTVPPTNWPDPPSDPTPTPPDVPEPDPPVTPDPPLDPTPPSNPVYTIQPIYNTSVFTADLSGVIDALDEHCQHLQNALYTDLKDFYDKITTKMTNDFSTLRTFLSGQVSWLGETITDSMDALQDYLYDLYHWLADELDFTVSGGDYDDSTVISWLKKIYYKLGGGTNTRPVDPVSDPFDFGQWLYELWQNFVLDLLALGRNGLAEVAYSLGELIHKFPFSIPWDIAAMLALLVAEPVTPVIDFPMFYYTGSSVQTVQTRIDLAPYNNFVEPVRIMIKIGFAFVLAWRTKDMMELLTMARGGSSA